MDAAQQLVANTQRPVPFAVSSDADAEYKKRLAEAPKRKSHVRSAATAGDVQEVLSYLETIQDPGEATELAKAAHKYLTRYRHADAVRLLEQECDGIAWQEHAGQHPPLTAPDGRPSTAVSTAGEGGGRGAAMSMETTVRYDPNTAQIRTGKIGSLRLHMDRGVALPIRDGTTASSDPFVRVVLWEGKAGQGRRVADVSTQIKLMTLNPVFDETFVLDVNAPACELELTAYDWDEDGTHDFMGKVVVPLREFIEDLMQQREDAYKRNLEAAREVARTAGFTNVVGRSLGGVKWERVGTTRPNQGRELISPALATSLASKTEFTKQEWDRFGITGLCSSDFCMVGDVYYKPAGEPIAGVREIYGRDTDYGVVGWDNATGIKALAAGVQRSSDLPELRPKLYREALKGVGGGEDSAEGGMLIFTTTFVPAARSRTIANISMFPRKTLEHITPMTPADKRVFRDREFLHSSLALDASWEKSRTLTDDVMWPKDPVVSTFDATSTSRRSLVHLGWRNLIEPTRPYKKPLPPGVLKNPKTGLDEIEEAAGVSRREEQDIAMRLADRLWGGRDDKQVSLKEKMQRAANKALDARAYRTRSDASQEIQRGKAQFEEYRYKEAVLIFERALEIATHG